MQAGKPHERIWQVLRPMTKEQLMQRIIDIMNAENCINTKDNRLCPQWDKLDLEAMERERRRLARMLYDGNYSK